VAFTYLKVKPAKCLCLVPVVLVLVSQARPRTRPPEVHKDHCLSWSCYFGVGLGLKNLVLFTSLEKIHRRFTRMISSIQTLPYEDRFRETGIMDTGRQDAQEPI